MSKPSPRVAAFLARKRANLKYATLRKRVAADDGAASVDKALVGISDLLDLMTEGIENLRENLDLNVAPKNASLKEKVAARARYGKSLRKLAEDSPADLETALSQFYTTIDEVADKTEELADDLGLEIEIEEEQNEKNEKAEDKNEKKEDKDDEDGEDKTASGSDAFITDRDGDKTANRDSAKNAAIRAVVAKLRKLPTSEIRDLLQ